jgi:hypothetical protein
VDVDDVLTAEDPTEDAFDTLLNAEVMVSEGGEQLLGTVTKRARGPDGLPIGTRHENSTRDSRLYEIRLPDGSSRELTHNLIAENLFSQCDSEGRQFQIIKEISDHTDPMGRQWRRVMNGLKRLPAASARSLYSRMVFPR